MEVRDKRMKAITECFSNIRFVKMCAMENYFLEKTCWLKDDELSMLGWNFVRTTCVDFCTRLSPLCFVVVLISFYFYLGNTLNVQTIFTILNIYATLSDKMEDLPTNISTPDPLFILA